MLHYLCGGGQMGDSFTYFPLFFFGFVFRWCNMRPALFCTIAKTKISDSNSDLNCCGRLWATYANDLYTAHFSCDPQFLLDRPRPLSPPAVPLPFSQTKANKCELLLVCLKCRSKGWTRRRAASRPAGAGEWVSGGGIIFLGSRCLCFRKAKRQRQQWGEGQGRRASKNT